MRLPGGGTENAVHRRADSVAGPRLTYDDDLTPGNLWLPDDGTAKIGDFGLAVALDRTRLTQRGGGTIVGTANYMPPGQALGGEVTPRSDLYSPGAMLR